MAWVSFDVFRTLGFTDTLHLKSDETFKYKAEIADAEWVLFPEYWQLNALTCGLKARVFPSESSYRLGHNKIEMTRAFELVAPANTPTTRIVANTPENASALWESMDHPFVAKLPKAARGCGVWLIEEREDWLAYLEKTDVLYVQEWLPIDRDIRVVIVGDQIVSAYWRIQAAQGFYNNVSKGGYVDHSPVPQAAIELALHLARTLDINHAGWDIAMVGEHPYAIEFNRLFGNQGIEGGNARLQEAILQYLRSNAIPTGPNFPTRPSSVRALKRVA